MSDLISRSAVIDVLKQTGIIQDNDLGHLVVDEINRIPTAYDMEKVVEQLDKASFLMSPREKGHYADNGLFLEDAIDIVRKGGVNE